MSLVEHLVLFVASFIANWFSALSGGGAGLIQFPMLIFLGLPFGVALATHKVATVFLGLGATFRHLKESHLERRMAILVLAAVLPGVALGAATILQVPERAATLSLGVLTMGLGVYSLLRPKLGLEYQPHNLSGVGQWVGMVGLFAVGFLNGSITSGSGLFLTLWLIRPFRPGLQARGGLHHDAGRPVLERYRRPGAGCAGRHRLGLDAGPARRRGAGRLPGQPRGHQEGQRLGQAEPVRTENVLEHKMLEEWHSVQPDTARDINLAKAQGRPVTAVGTTVVRTLESAWREGEVRSGRRATSLFIYPGFEFRAVDRLLTNFHLPRSTLLMLVSAFAGCELTMEAYLEAVRERYRFFSYGACKCSFCETAGAWRRDCR